MDFKKYFIASYLQTQTNYPFQILGDYRSGHVIYKIELDGFFSIWTYHSLGGKWLSNGSGTYEVEDVNKIRLSYKKKYREDEYFFVTKDANGIGLSKENLTDEKSYNDYPKLDYPKIVVCHNASEYPNALVPSHKYYAIDEMLNLYRIIGENQKVRWYPKEFFKELIV